MMLSVSKNPPRLRQRLDERREVRNRLLFGRSAARRDERQENAEEFQEPVIHLSRS